MLLPFGSEHLSRAKIKKTNHEPWFPITVGLFCIAFVPWPHPEEDLMNKIKRRGTTAAKIMSAAVWRGECLNEEKSFSYCLTMWEGSARYKIKYLKYPFLDSSINKNIQPENVGESWDNMLLRRDHIPSSLVSYVVCGKMIEIILKTYFSVQSYESVKRRSVRALCLPLSWHSHWETSMYKKPLQGFLSSVPRYCL